MVYYPADETELESCLERPQSEHPISNDLIRKAAEQNRPSENRWKLVTDIPVHLVAQFKPEPQRFSREGSKADDRKTRFM